MAAAPAVPHTRIEMYKQQPTVLKPHAVLWLLKVGALCLPAVIRVMTHVGFANLNSVRLVTAPIKPA